MVLPCLILYLQFGGLNLASYEFIRIKLDNILL